MEFLENDGPYVFYDDENYSLIKGKFEDDKFIHVKEAISSLPIAISIPKKYIRFEAEIQQKHTVPPNSYDNPEKILALSDVEGDFDFFYKVLLHNNVINNKLEWTYGTNHLVILGDMFDRGDLVTEALWLMYKLDYEAKKAGGYVHVILGNHEEMVLSGDDRYIHEKYEKVVKSIGLEYDELYSRKTVLGDWLRSKNSVEIIGNTLFVHGGMSPIVRATEMTVETINNQIRNVLQYNKGDMMSSQDRLLMGSNGPLWFRDYVEQKITQDEVNSILKFYGADQIIVGHTVVDQITPLYGNSIYAIDVKRKNNTTYEALLIENGEFYKVTTKEDKIPL